MIVRAWWIISVLALLDYAWSPLAITDAIQKKLIDESNHNINLQKLSPNITLSSTATQHETWIWSNFMGNLFRVVCSWLTDMLQAWKFFWWPSTKIIGTPNDSIELFRDTGKISMTNVSNSLLSPSPSPKVHSQSVVHSVVLQAAGGPTSQPSRQPTRQPTRRPSRRPSSQPTRQPTSRPSQPSGQPSRQPTRYDRILSPFPLPLIVHFLTNSSLYSFFVIVLCYSVNLPGVRHHNHQNNQ